MNKTQIEWVKNPDGSPGYTFNPITGCLNHVNGLCKGGGFPCYAYRLAHGRLKSLYLANKNVAPVTKNVLLPNLGFVEMNSFYPRFWPERLYDLLSSTNIKIARDINPRGIFVCDMSDLFGRGIPEKWTQEIMGTIKVCRWHRFYLLTKQPQNLLKWSPFPDNCYVGVTVTSNGAMTLALTNLANIQAKVKFISFEPLLGSIGMNDHMSMKGIVDWAIIGACTGTKDSLLPLHHKTGLPMIRLNQRLWALLPRIEWVKEIVEAADKAGIPVFMKDNLLPLFRSIPYEKLGTIFFDKSYLPNEFVIRQEMPQC